MSEAESPTDVAPKIRELKERLRKGHNLIADMEERREVGAKYDRYLDHWLALLAEYESLCDGGDAGTLPHAS